MRFKKGIRTVIPAAAEVMSVVTVIDGAVSTPRDWLVSRQAAGSLGVKEKDG
ncbi:hypothetical protein DPMN_047838 [Dreissena polymorpha]|uniref:Uncharacterized protein n=1 Tax=Dreissena polymorpha TaxID=45954 RepID=A0A9D4DAG6_DREPO|nr:hypothetical protein DPMN_047838 [Dreissena polymorpha]